LSTGGDPLEEMLGVAAICDERGRITDILRDDLGLLVGQPQSLEEVIDAPDRPKLARLLKEAMALQPAFDRILDAGRDGRTERLHFGASFRDGSILVSAARSRQALMRLNLASAAVVARARAPLQQPADPPSPTTVKDLAVYDDLSRLNNELATTERRLTKSNLDLDRANRELRAFYETLPVGIFRADVTGRVEHANKRFCTLTGASSPAEWLGRVQGEDAESVNRRWRKTILHGVAFDSVHRQLNEGQPARHVEMKAVVLRDENAKTVGIVGLVEDISERARIEEQQREIERYDAIQQLIGGLAHNLNNIMMVMLSSAEQLSDELPSQHALHAAALNNMAATERAALLTRRLLAYAGAGGMFSGKVEVDSTIEAICRDLRAELGDRHELSMSLGAPNKAIKIGSDLFVETVQELVRNAKAAMSQGGIIRLSTALASENEAANRCIVVITVADEGIGMDDETLRRAKEPFFTTREVGRGVGLGLSLADGMARIAGGGLAIRSQSGKGTVVELRLPVIE
jgi:PAS domain S-box-containing protein